MGVIFCPSSIFLWKQIFFRPKIGHRNKHNYKMGAWWQNLRLVHDSTLFFWILTQSLCSYRNPNLVLVLQMWENLESNLPVCNYQRAILELHPLDLKYRDTVEIIMHSSNLNTRCRAVASGGSGDPTLKSMFFGSQVLFHVSLMDLLGAIFFATLAYFICSLENFQYFLSRYFLLKLEVLCLVFRFKILQMPKNI